MVYQYHVKKKNIFTYLDKIGFKHIFVVWMAMILLFGVGYHLVNTYKESVLVSGKGDSPTGYAGLMNSIYFSFITATSTGYGDIIPVGIARFMALSEVIIGLLLFGVIISKLVSVKQETILQEIYDLSFEEKINRLRSALHLFRNDANKLIDHLEKRTVTKRQIEDLWITFTPFDVSLSEINRIIHTTTRKQDNEYVKKLDELHIELLLNGVTSSLAKTLELLHLLHAYKIDWKKNEMFFNILNSSVITAGNIHQFCKEYTAADRRFHERVNDLERVLFKVKYMVVE